jgi:hypothetical protein
VTAHIGRSRHSLTHRFKELGLQSPHRIYIEARDRRYEQLDNEGKGPIDIATMTGTSVYSVEHWLQTREAGVPNTGKSLKNLQKVARKDRQKTTDGQQKQLSWL